MPRLQPGQFWGRAIGAVKVGFAPGFRDDPGTLRAAVVRGSQIAGHGKIHVLIRSVWQNEFKPRAS